MEEQRAPRKWKCGFPVRLLDKRGKTDFAFALIIGGVNAVIIYFIARNLSAESPLFRTLFHSYRFLLVLLPVVFMAGLFTAHLLTSLIPFLYQFAKFSLVGSMNFLVDMGILNSLIFYTGICNGPAQSGLKGVSFVLAAVNSYFWNKFWTFKRGSGKRLRTEVYQFLVISTSGFFVNILIDYLFVNNIGPRAGIMPHSWAQVSAMAAAVASLCWNFIGYKFIVFHAGAPGHAVMHPDSPGITERNG